jgi:NitT/TauT family transport system substrate-binding protein
MKKIFSILLISVLVACTAKPLEWENLTILSPKGAPAIALVPLIQENKDSIEFVDGTDVLSAELIKGEKDVIIAPVNLGAALSKKDSNPYRLYGIVTWGNLYLVSNADVQLVSDEPIAIFGEQAVPGLVFNSLKDQLGQTFVSTAFNAVTDVQGQLLSKSFNIGLMAEPLVTATIAKAKTLETPLNLNVYKDLQLLWEEKTGFDNYPQAAIYIKADISDEKLKQVEARLELMMAYNIELNNNPTILETDITEELATTLGVPSSKILTQAWDRMNVNVVKAEENKEAIEAFLELFKLNGLENLYY